MTQKQDNRWLIWTAGTILAISMAVVTAIAGTTGRNEKNNVKEHVAIRKESLEGENRVRQEMITSFKELRTEQRLMHTEQVNMWKAQNKNFTQILIKLGKLSR